MFMNNNNNINPLIFTKKVNNKIKIIPLKKSMLVLGATRHFPASTREWYNSIYAYNNNTLNSLSISDKILNSVIKSYFNLYFNNKTLKAKYIATRFRRTSLNKIFFGKAELKHTNSRVIITLYVYNEERRLLNYKLDYLLNIIYSNKPLTQYTPFSLKHNLSNYNFLKENISFKLYLDKLYFSICTAMETNVNIFNLTNIEEYKKYENIIKDISLYLSINTIKDYKELKQIYERFVFYNAYEDIVKELSYYKFLLSLNKSKFENHFLSKLIFLIKILYNKEIEFNIVNLKSMALNSDIFTEAIALKLKNRDNKLWKVLRYSLSIIKLPYFYRVRDNYKKRVLKELLVNKVNKSHLKSIIVTSNSFTLNKLLLNIFPNSSLKALTKKPVNMIETKENYINLNNKNIENIVIDSLKYRNIQGGRLEAKGRLTRRFTASRSVFRMKWRGSLKDIDASYRGWSSVVLRGNLKSNLQYSVVNSKTRNGTFGLKGWISGK